MNHRSHHRIMTTPLHGLCVRRVVAVLWLNLILLSVPATAAPSLAEVPVPLNARLEVISTAAVHNGRVLSMATFDAPQSADATVAFYRTVWPDPMGSDMPGMVVTRLPGWLLLSRLKDGYNTVVQISLDTAHQSTGYVSIMRIAGNASDDSSGTIDELPVELLSATSTDDGFSSSQLSVYRSALPVAALAEQFVQLRRDQRWSLTSQQEYGGSQIVLMKAKDQQLEMVVSRDDSAGSMGSIAVLNEITTR